MKKILLLAVILLITITGVLILSKNTFKNVTLKIPTNEDNQNSGDLPDAQITPQTVEGYKSVWLSVNDTDKLFLYSNLDNTQSSKDLATKNSCLHLISGGFYNKKGEHIGLLVSEGNTISESQENSLFNAYFSISKSGTVSITDYPIFTPRISLQSGPYLLKNSNVNNLNLSADENARRMAVGITKNKTILFLSVYSQSNSFSGPKLSELPEIIDIINKENNLSLVNVINLDGGAHSAFITDLVTLSEASPLGSFFCVKP